MYIPKIMQDWVNETEKEAGRRMGVQVYDNNMNYSSDPDYPVDWCDGEFS